TVADGAWRQRRAHIGDLEQDPEDGNHREMSSSSGHRSDEACTARRAPGKYPKCEDGPAPAPSIDGRRVEQHYRLKAVDSSLDHRAAGDAARETERERPDIL